jgi:GT2 family glycosyltransferase
MTNATLSISVVTYAPDIELLRSTLRSLDVALKEARAAGLLKAAALTLVDNGPGNESAARLEALLREVFGGEPEWRCAVMTGHGNVGYGRANNLGLLGRDSDYLLVLNPDVIIGKNGIAAALRFMNEHPEAGLLTPLVRGERGERQYLCKRFPAVLDLALRGFAPTALRRLFAARLARYEMRDVPDTAVHAGIPIVSGCFMFFRGDVFRRLGGFDPRFFMYFEDFDLSLRAGKLAANAFVPAVEIVHYGGSAARKGLRHIRMFARSAFTFFGKHGWHWF